MKAPSSLGSKLVHAAGFGLRALIVAITFLVALVAAVLAHLGLPSARRIAVRELNAVLAPSFAGTITVEDVHGLGIFGARGVTAHVDAADGTRVLYARGARAAIFPFRVVRSFLFGKGDIAIDIDVLSLDYVEVNLDTDEHGDLKLAHAFDPKTPTPPPTKPGRGMRLDFPRAGARHVWVHGSIASVPPIDAELDGVTGSLLVAPDMTTIDLSNVALLTRAMPDGANPRGEIEAHVKIPSGDGDTDLAALFAGFVGGIPTMANASMRGKQFDAVLDVPEVAAQKCGRFHLTSSSGPS